MASYTGPRRKRGWSWTGFQSIYGFESDHSCSIRSWLCSQDLLAGACDWAGGAIPWDLKPGWGLEQKEPVSVKRGRNKEGAVGFRRWEGQVGRVEEYWAGEGWCWPREMVLNSWPHHNLPAGKSESFGYPWYRLSNADTLWIRTNK